MNVLELVLPSILPTLSIVGAIIYLRRYIPSLMQQAINDIGEQLTEGITANIKDPQVKRAMSIIGKKSGDVRADKALREKISNKIIEESPLIGKVLEYFDVTPYEGLKLLNDPFLAPWIQKFLASGVMPTQEGQTPQGAF